jgi:hypothetical protein
MFSWRSAKLVNLRCNFLRRLRVFEKWRLRKIFELKRDEVTGEWRKLYNKELHNLCSLSSRIRKFKPRMV